MPELTERAIQELRPNGRASFSDIARRLGTTRAQITGRLLPLLESGQLRIRAVAHPQLLGLDYVSHLLVAANGDLAPIIHRLERISTLVFIAEIAGTHQLIVELHARSLRELHDSVHELRAIRGVQEVEVHLYEQQLNTYFVGEEPGRTFHSLDSADLALLGCLQRDGRMSFRELSEQSGLSVSGCRLRMNRMLEAGVMQIGVVRYQLGSSGHLTFGFGFRVMGPSDELVSAVRAEVGLEFLVRTVGRFDFIATIVFKGAEEVRRFLARARGAAHVEGVECWMHLSVVLERFYQSAERIAKLSQGSSAEPGALEPDSRL